MAYIVVGLSLFHLVETWSRYRTHKIVFRLASKVFLVTKKLVYLIIYAKATRYHIYSFSTVIYTLITI